MYEMRLSRQIRESLIEQAIDLLKTLISTPSHSKEENQTAQHLKSFLNGYGISAHRQDNNIWAIGENCENDAPTILLNSHHDTIRPSSDWTKNPYIPIYEGDRLYGLGSNDAGGAVVSLLAAFIYLTTLPKLPFRLIVAITAEEEISGVKGVRSILKNLGPIDLGIVGEPTEMKMAIAEKGLIVLDCQAQGKAGHSARNEGINALYLAMDDINFIRSHQFEKVSPVLGEVLMTVTQINAGHQHNVIPASCEFVIDIRTNECYKNEEIIAFIKDHIKSRVTPRSYWLNSSRIDPHHPIVLKGEKMGLTRFGSATLSDQALMNFPTVKIGPGESRRSHTADEYILLSEIKEGINTYIKLLSDLELNKN